MRVRLWATARGEGILPLRLRIEGVGTPNAKNRVWEPFPPSNRGQDARDTQGRDGLATSLVTLSLEARYPLLAAAVEGKAGMLPATQKGLELSTRGTLVTAFGPNPDGRGTVLRLWEHAGVRGPCEVRLPAGLGIKEVQPVNLRGAPVGKPLPVEKGAFTTNLTAFAPASFIIFDTLKERP
jgi:hypothetical protein